jgi:hypothetical protein
MIAADPLVLVLFAVVIHGCGLDANRGSKWSGAAQTFSFADDARRVNKHA